MDHFNDCILNRVYANTVEPRYKEVGYITTPSYNKVILLVPLFIFLCFFTLI